MVPFELRRCVHQVVLAQESGFLEAKGIEPASDIVVEVAQLERCDFAVAVLAYER